MKTGQRKSRKIRMIRNILIAVWIGIPWTLAGETPRVVASIPPIHSLVSGVMQGVGSPTLIIKGYASPHTYQMRPSDAAKLHNADVVFWIGDTLETFLRKPLSALPTQAIPLIETEGLTLHRNREGGAWDTHTHTHDSHATTESTHGDNPHIWLDPGNARQLVKAIARHLGRIDPTHGARYEANANRLLQRINALEKRIGERLSGIRTAPYLVFHDAFLYLERRYELHAVGSITANPDQIPGARRIANLRSTIKRLDIRCIFREPQFNTKLIETVLEGSDSNMGILDPLGVDIRPGPDHWFEMMENHAEVMVDCLSEG
uniref:High-affinity zinc uptake system protein ZnuA n=1 Tax=Candidatus Kentrum sp. TUN TaxID=2126343 RepID=A0A450ZIZ2_9GAMM|nr:MAG: zinc transport system substrate-binding protein [Candidatus Kentron sp. TUN]VFK57774.1 MAG: zinc transport system substrate-binding protein [Candidatus Kentron sp. TUN]VFK61550.1 MAG: zinc transport system substrate-binding protein [Candidatus Kentron sp. TUN]